MSKKPTGFIAIHGREYETVASRVNRFRVAHPDWTIKTTILHRDFDAVVMLAEILTDQGRVVATGHAEEFRTSSSINKTSAVENCETSAIGRALFAFGMGGTEFASADEVQHAVSGGKPSVDDMIPQERQDVIRAVADAILQAHGKGDEWACYEAFAAISDSEERLLLWRHLQPHSAVRSAIKRMAEAEKAGEAA